MTYTTFDAEDVMQQFEDPDVVCQILGLLKADIPRYLAECQDALAAGDHTTAQRAAHTIKGAASNVSAHQACDLAKAIEMALRAGQTDVSPLVPQLASACGQLLDDLTAWEATLRGQSHGAR